MRRRTFITVITQTVAGLVLYMPLRANAFKPGLKKIKGRVLCEGRGIEKVAVSDGYSVVITDKDGGFVISMNDEASSIFISTPAGYHFIEEKGIARHYYAAKDCTEKKEILFNLNRIDGSDNEHQFIIWADPQVKNKSDVKLMMNTAVPDVKKYMQSLPSGALIHGITVGDMVWDNLNLLDEYSDAVRAMGLPFFQCIGNHDMDYGGTDDTSDNTFQQAYGPTYYSFNRGDAHYIVLDNVRYLGTEREYDGYIDNRQLEWLKKDLTIVPKNKLIIVCLHIPVFSQTKNRNEFYKIVMGRNVHIMSGHTHYHVNVVQDKIYEHNHGTVCGAWWTGDICRDGTPNGYAIYKVVGNKLRWHYKAIGKPSHYQMRLYVQPYNDQLKQVIANVWNADPSWKIECMVDGKKMGSLEQFEGWDPLAFETLSGPDKPAKRGFAEPNITNHLFKILVPVSASKIVVTARNSFGNLYTENV